MEIADKLGYFAFGGLFITGVLFVAFGQITVRKLRKNQSTKDQLGLELASGWDILNVAQALALPKALTDRFKESYLSAMFANTDLLREHTNAFDRALAAIFFWLYAFTGISLMLLTAHYFIFIE